MAIGQFYTDGFGCGHDTDEPTIEAINLKSWQAMIDQIGKDLFNGKLKPTDFHDGLVDRTHKELQRGAKSGFGVQYAKDETGLKIKDNLFRFSVAKTYQQLEEMQSFLVDEKGQLRNFEEFKKGVDTVHENYNLNYLKVEHQAAKRSAQAARQWAEFQDDKDLFPNLQYRTIGDDRVREEHQELEGIIKPLDDPFWDTHYPPNGFRCRCTVQATDSDVRGGDVKVEVHPAFRNNVGKTGTVFDEEGHPYFTMDKSTKTAYKKYLDGRSE